MRVDGPTVDGARASGGPVQAGKTYVVGEKGPELFSPGRTGFVSPNEVYARASAGTSSRATPARVPAPITVSVNLGGIHGITDPAAIAERVAELIGRNVRDAMSGIQSDVEYAPGL